MAQELQKANTVCLIILASVAITAGLAFTKPVMIPLVFAFFSFAVVSPFILFLKVKLRVPRIIAILLTLFLLTLISFLIGLFTVSSVNGFILGFAVYKDRFLQLSTDVLGLASHYGVEVDSQWVKKELSQLPVFSLAKGLTGILVVFISNFTLVALFVLFMILGENTQPDHKKHPLVQNISFQISKYVITKASTSLLTGIISLIIFVGFGLELAVMFAIFTILLNFIPTIGSMIAVLLPIPVILMQFGLGWELPTILGLLGLTQFSIGSVMEPKLIGESMDLHPVTVMGSLVFWGLVWGLPGMFLAVPITATVKIVLHHMKVTRALSEILAGRLPRFAEVED